MMSFSTPRVASPMRSLIWKDFVAARRLLLLLVIPLGGVQLAVLASVPPIYPTAAPS
jgi:hypothetical protein